MVFNAFGAVKVGIGTAPGFTADDDLFRFGSWLHGGNLEVLATRSAAGAGLIPALDTAYYLWMSLLALGVGYWMMRGHSKERLQFWLAFVLCWLVLGNLLAVAVPSAGPVYWHLLQSGSDPFQQLRAHLSAADAGGSLVTPFLQEQLWREHLRGASNPFTGISAFPSMHVAMPVLFSLSFRGVSRIAAFATAFYALVVLIGSVVLGWHYALDGYAAVLGAVGLWYVAGWVARTAWLWRGQ